MRRIQKIIIISMVLLFIGGSLWAAASEDTVLTLEKALSVAKEQNLDILSAQQELVRAKGKLTEARAGGLPSLNLGAGYTRREKPDLAGNDEENIFGAALTLTQPLYQGGKIRAGKQQASIEIQQAEYYYVEIAEQVALNVYNRFYAVLLEKENVKTAEDAFAFAEKYLDEVKKKHVLGLATGLEITRAEKQQAESRTALIRARNNLEVAKINLLELLNVKLDTSYTIEGNLSYAPVAGQPEESLKKALAYRPDYQRAKLQVDVQDQQIRIAQSGLKPSASVSGSYRYDDPEQAYYESGDTWQVRLTVDIPVMDSGLTHGRIVQQKALREQTMRNVEKKEESIRSEVSSVYLDLKTAAQVLEEAKLNLKLAEETLRLAEVGYREGVGIQLDVLDARASLTQARREYSAAVKDYAFAIVRLRKAEGVLTEEPVLP
ncbi:MULTISPECIES: TolC family protein [Aminobacterium]|jgi:outer membrane protein|uniref:Outer membrane efflux protein n=1 Tax=Aminobacterium colombiense (strain DSM 12261 / ALA-1) TaxID=572547 RepID=D5EFK7_AMICL|nr:MULTISPECIES: TolC family protein [Aminobacterium]ADE57339.1 outer membrane efflux protein [Aminobacterium colombiense DSM 12261]NLK30070.1 TolC family protein [Aminobacterium colombiense]